MMSFSSHKAADYIRQKAADIEPKVGIILGSGLGELVNEMTNVSVIPYAEIPNFPSCTIKGHGGNLHIGLLHGIPTACYEGRVHLYEGTSNEAIQTFIRTLKLIGCETLIVTNSAGSLNRDVSTGNLVLVKDHINLQFSNPLVGPNDESFGPRFIGMDDTYDLELRRQILELSQKNKIPVTEGVFAGVLGPSFETPAEINMLKAMGADTVAMSLIPEVIVARHCGMRIAAISAISNLAAGLHNEKLSHDVTLRGAQIASKNLVKLIDVIFTSGVVTSQSYSQ